MTHPMRRGLELARERLKKDGHYDLQAYVDAALAPRGWMALRDSEKSGPTVPLSLTITKGLKTALKAAEVEFDSVLASLAEEGFRAVLETDWLPSQTVSKQSHRTDPDNARAVLQLQVDSELRDRVREALPELSERAGYTVSLSSVALSWMADQLGVQRPGENTQPLLLQWIPRAWCDHWEQVAAEHGVTLQSVMEDGIRALRDGSWEMPKPVRSAKGSGVKVTADNEVRKFMVRVDAELLEFLEEQAPLLAEKHDRRVFPGTIGLAILKDRLGLPGSEKVPAVSRSKGGRKSANVQDWDPATRWTAQQCAAFRGISREQWMHDVDAGVEPESVDVAAGGIELWDAADVRGY